MIERKIMGNYGPPVQYVSPTGETYNLLLTGPGVHAKYSEQVFLKKVANLKAMRDLYSDEEFKAERDALKLAYEKGDLGLYGQLGQDYLVAPEGAVLYAAIVFQCSEQRMFNLMAHDPDGVKDKLTQAHQLSRSERHDDGGEPSPNPQAPALVA